MVDSESTKTSKIEELDLYLGMVLPELVKPSNIFAHRTWQMSFDLDDKILVLELRYNNGRRPRGYLTGSPLFTLPRGTRISIKEFEYPGIDTNQAYWATPPVIDISFYTNLGQPYFSHYIDLKKQIESGQMIGEELDEEANSLALDTALELISEIAENF